MRPPAPPAPARTLAADVAAAPPGHVVTLCGHVHRRRELATVSFLVLRDRTGLAQVVLRPHEVPADGLPPEETAENLKKYGGVFPGIRPGKKSAEFIDYVLTRVTVVGGAYLAVVCLIPEVLFFEYNLSFSMGGTSILIVVSVTMDTVAQIQSHLIAHQYGDLIKRAKLKGGRTR